MALGVHLHVHQAGPGGLQVTGVAPADDGVRVRVEATDTVLQG